MGHSVSRSVLGGVVNDASVLWSSAGATTYSIFSVTVTPDERAGQNMRKPYKNIFRLFFYYCAELRSVSCGCEMSCCAVMG